jgi:hypothetical protein
MTAPTGGFTTPLVPGAIENGVAETVNLNTAFGGGETFFDNVDYIGAVRDVNDDWFKVWTIPGSF